VPKKWNDVEVLRELKKVDPVVKAIWATGYGQTERVVLAKQEGFKEVLVKPFEIEELLGAFRSFPFLECFFPFLRRPDLLSTFG